MWVIIFLCFFAILCVIAFGFFCGGMMEFGSDKDAMFHCIFYISTVVLIIILAYFYGLTTTTFYCKECNYKTTNSNIQYCPNDGDSLEVFVYGGKRNDT